MVIFRNKFLVKLIVSVCLFLTIMASCTITNKVQAGTGDDEEQVWGGILINPIVRLLVGLGDAVVDVLHENILKQDGTLIKIDGSDSWMKIITAVIAVALAVAVIIVSTEVVVGLVTAEILTITTGIQILKIGTVILIAGAGTGVAAAERIQTNWIPNDVYLPVYKLTPQEIFANKIPLFDVNFFEPGTYTRELAPTEESRKKIYSKSDKATSPALATEPNDFPINIELEKYISGLSISIPYEDEKTIITKQEITEDFINTFSSLFERLTTDIEQFNIEAGNGCYISMKLKKSTNSVPSNYSGSVSNTNTYTIEILKNDGKQFIIVYEHTRKGDRSGISFDELMEVFEVTPEKSGGTETIQSTAAQLQGIVSQWYFTLRNLALLVLMILLIYSGIRIVIDSTAAEKAKHKERIIDWLVAICLVFIMHYIMVFAVELNEKIIELIDVSAEKGTVIKSIGLGDENNTKYKNAKKINEIQGYIQQEKTDTDGDGTLDYYVVWETDLMGGMRINVQESNEGTATWVGAGICFLILVAYTLFFAWTYLKRLVYMTFLTMVAPLVAMTYPIDKINDGKAQAFNTWLKEYIFNLLIQPMHLLLYTILVSSAYELAAKNILYAIVAIGFMVPSEKLVRKFFGFEKAQTPGLLGGAAGAALAMTGMQQVMRWGQNHGGRGREDKESSDSAKIKYSSSDGINAMDVMMDEAMDGEFDGEEGQTQAPAVRTVNPPNATQGAPGSKAPYTAEEWDEDPSMDYYGAFGNIITPPQQTQMPSVSIPQPGQVPQITVQGSQGKKASNKKGRIRRTIGGVSSAYSRELRHKALKRIENGRPIRAMARGIAGLAGGAALGMMGLVFGIASGDPNKAFQYASTGALGGFQAGKGLAGSAVDTLSVNPGKMADEMELAWYDADEYKKAMYEKQKKEILEDESYITYIRKTTGKTRKQAIEMLEDTGSRCLDSGVRDVEDMIAVHQMRENMVHAEEQRRIANNQTMTEQEKTDMDEYALRQSIAMKKLSDRLPTDIRKMGEKKIEAHRKQFQREMEAKLQKQIKGELVSKIRTKSGDEIRESITRELQAKGKNVFTPEMQDEIEKLTTERIGRVADEQIAKRAKAASEEMIKGITEFAETKAGISEV